ncbi:hypothetical protein ACN08P_23495 (plasmid) [Photobacterium leiognathi subsp. mandapamensis]|uniref:hypothetical protein n=1 Tax=Photobacterium leiognathi TaxID=553611 RepID=UPI003AF338FA
MDNRTQKTLSVLTARFPIQNPNGLWTIQHITKKQNTLSHKGQLKLTTQHQSPTRALSVLAIQKEFEQQRSLTQAIQKTVKPVNYQSKTKEFEQQRSVTQANQKEFEHQRVAIQKTVKTNQPSIKRQRSLNTYELLFKTSTCDIHHKIEEVMYQ